MSISEKNGMSRDTNIRQNEQGLVAVVVTVFVMVVLSLIVLSFSQISRREQRQALDRQLSSQAFYAAESGINSVVSKLRADNTLPSRVEDCGNQSTNKLDSSGVISYSCVMYDREPKTLEYGRVPIEENQIISLQTTTNKLHSVTFEWDGADAQNNYANCMAAGNPTEFPPVTGPGAYDCSAGMLRVMIMPSDSGDVSRDKLVSESFTAYFRPTNAAGTNALYVSYGASVEAQGGVYTAHCNAGKCTATITDLPYKDIFASMRSIYKENKVTVKGTNDDGTEANFNQEQVKVDATGRANDVVRRIQVRVPLRDKPPVPAYTVESVAGLCKRITVLPNNVSEPGCL